MRWENILLTTISVCPNEFLFPNDKTDCSAIYSNSQDSSKDMSKAIAVSSLVICNRLSNRLLILLIRKTLKRAVRMNRVTWWEYLKRGWPRSIPSMTQTDSRTRMKIQHKLLLWYKVTVLSYAFWNFRGNCLRRRMRNSRGEYVFLLYNKGKKFRINPYNESSMFSPILE